MILIQIAAEDFNRACQVHRIPKEKNVASCWRINGSRKLSPQKAAVLARLCEYREDVAKKINVPVFKVLSAASLLQLAEETPKSVNQLLRTGYSRRKVHPTSRRRIGKSH